MTDMATDPPKGEAIIFFSGPIAPDMCQSLIDKVSRFATQRYREVHLLMSSEGGDMNLALSVHNLLRGFRVRLSTYNVSVVGSAAMIIFLAGERRFATENATFFIHETTTGVVRSDGWQLRSAQNLVDGISDNEDRYNALIAERTGQQPAVVKRWAANIEWFDFASAKAHGIIEDFGELDIATEHTIEYVMR